MSNENNNSFWKNLLNKDNVQPALLTASGAAISYVLYWNLFGNELKTKNKDLEEQLQQTEKKVKDLQQKLLSLETSDLREGNDGSRKEIRVWMDGAFDMMHFGHMNAFRQGRSLGTYLIAGINSDESITACKGPPVCNEKERVDTVRGCKWVDEVVENVPYVMNDEYLTYIIEKYKIDYIVHGDDPCIVDGKNVYESAIKLGKYLTIPRTEGVSTTDIVGRMLLLSRAHHDLSKKNGTAEENSLKKLVRTLHDEETHDRKSNFLTTSRIIRLFGAGVKAPKPTDRVVYIAGGWDMFHAGHIEALEKAKKLGDYLIVGIHNDQIVNQKKGLNYPIMTLHERTLSVLGCRHVDDVLIDAPYSITQEMLSSLHIQVVARACPAGSQPTEDNVEDPFALPRSLGMLTTVYINHTVTAEDFVERIQQQQERYAKRYVKKMEAEKEFYKNKYSL